MGGTSDSVKFLVLSDEAVKLSEFREGETVFILVKGLTLLCSYSHSLTWPLVGFDHADSERLLKNPLRDYSSRIACMKIL